MNDPLPRPFGAAKAVLHATSRANRSPPSSSRLALAPRISRAFGHPPCPASYTPVTCSVLNSRECSTQRALIQTSRVGGFGLLLRCTRCEMIAACLGEANQFRHITRYPFRCSRNACNLSLLPSVVFADRCFSPEEAVLPFRKILIFRCPVILHRGSNFREMPKSTEPRSVWCTWALSKDVLR